jgi:hypothetical protein
MGKTLQRLVLVLICLPVISLHTYAQGPAGIGNSDGSGGQPRNVLWLRADAGVTESSGSVSAWSDQSGNALNAVQATGSLQPTFVASTTAMNNQPSLTFTTTELIAVPDNDLLDDGVNFSFFLALRTPNDANSGFKGILNKRTGANSNQAYRFFTNNGAFNSDMSSGADASSALSVEYNYVLGGVYDGGLSSNEYTMFVNSINSSQVDAPNTIPNEASPLNIGNFQNGDSSPADHR